MGDVSTHAKISHFVAGQLKDVVPEVLVPHDHYTYLEFGNYLTDVSQFRDPPAHHGGRGKAHRNALWTAVTWGGMLDGAALILLAPLWLATAIPIMLVAYGAGLRDWTARLFGRDEPETERHGALAEFFRRISFGIAHQVFTQEGREAVAKSIERRAGVPVLSVVFSPDGNLVATTHIDGTARLWAIATGDEVRTLAGHTGPVTSVTFSPDGNQLATAGFDRNTKLWTVATGAEVRTLAGHAGAVTSVAFSPDGNQLATAGSDRRSKLWTVATGAEVRSLAGHTAEATAVAFSPDGTLLATASKDATAKLWTVATGAEVRTLAGHTAEATAVAFSPDGTLLATASKDATAKLWTVATGAEVRTLAGHTAEATAVAFSPDGTLLATASKDATAKLWTVATGAEVRTLAGHTAEATAVAFSPDGTLLATASLSGTTRLWAVDTGEVTTTFVGHSGPIPVPDQPPPISPEAVDALHNRYFTQYWPHEHLDFPMVDNAEQHGDMPRFAPSPRNVLTYIEEHVEGLAQQFAALEHDWVQAKGGAAADRIWLMVRLGHLLHVVEDYWFHSNFAELYRWGRVRLAEPGRDPAIDADRSTLLDAALAEGGVATSVQQQRLLRRRLRYPVFTGGELSDLSEDTSEDGTEFVFTGGFGESDIFHTLGKALESMQHGEMAPMADGLAASGITLFEVLFDEQVRRDMVVDSDESNKADEHKEQLLAREIDDAINALEAAGELCQRAAQEFRSAFDLDREVENEWSLFPGVGGMLIHLVAMMQAERDASTKRQAELDADLPSIHDIATANGASVENVGTHSLIAKDAKDSDPFRDDAVRLAKHASASIARHLITRVDVGPGEDEGIDWPDLLDFYLPFPRPDGPSWWSEVVGNPTDELDQPDVGDVMQPAVIMLGPTNDQAKLTTLRAGGRIAELEDYYVGFET